MPPTKRTLAAVKGGKAPATTPRATIAQTEMKAQRIFELVASGMTVTEAGEAMEPPMSKSQASTLFNRALQATIEADTSLRQAMLERELETLRLLKKHWMPRAISGDPQAANIILKVVDRVADLAGLSTTLKVQISNQRIDETVSRLVSLVDKREDQIPKLLESGVLVIDAPSSDEAAG
jgi:hypothetical protein